jgi:hypothetical protein
VPQGHNALWSLVPQGHNAIWSLVPQGHNAVWSLVPQGHNGVWSLVPQRHNAIWSLVPQGHNGVWSLVPQGHNGVWSLVPQRHNGVPIILNRCKYDLMLPCPVTMDVKFWVMFIFLFSLSATTGKYSFVISPFVFWSHSLCLFSRSLTTEYSQTTAHCNGYYDNDNQIYVT